MSGSDGDETSWVETHRDALLGMDADAASDMVRAAGFRPIVKIPRPGVAFASAYWGGSVSLVCIDGVVTRATAG